MSVASRGTGADVWDVKPDNHHAVPLPLPAAMLKTPNNDENGSLSPKNVPSKLSLEVVITSVLHTEGPQFDPGQQYA
ncbi:hypothetical protein V6N13_147699 [Hibiscus sabdariffa]